MRTFPLARRFLFPILTFAFGFTIAALIFGASSVSAQNNCATATPAASVVRPTAAPDTGTRLNPVPLGSRKEVVRRPGTPSEEHFAFTITEVIRGKPAADIIFAGDKDNERPPVGFEYLLARVEFEYLKGSSENPRSISAMGFTSLSFRKDFGDTPVIVNGVKDLFMFSGKPGENATGWIPAFVASTDPSPLLGYEGTRTTESTAYFATTK